MSELEGETLLHEYIPRGRAADLFFKYNVEEYDEILFEGVAGGGKSLAYAMYIHAQCVKYPGLQVLMVRKYRDSMSESCMKTFEEEVLKHHMPEVCDGRDRTQRPHYEYPPAYNPYAKAEGKSRVVMCGITDEEKIRSTAWNIIWLNEGTEITLPHYETLLSRSRPAGIRWAPHNVILIDCNPSFEKHWLNTRFKPDNTSDLKRLRLVTSHYDNPTYWDEEKNDWTEVGRRYMAKLKSLTGARYERLYKGKWCSEEGLVYAEFEPSYHIIQRSQLPTIEYYFGSVDWGFRNAGVIQIWGVASDQSMYLVHETYRTQQTVDFWSEEAVRLYLKYKPIAYVCDPASPDKRAQFNDRLSRFRGGQISRIAIEANNDREAGMQEIKSALLRQQHLPTCGPMCTRPDRHGHARMFFCDDALQHGRDPILAANYASVCTTDEMQNLVWLKTADGKPIQEKWDDSIPHDGLDATRYAAMFNWQRSAKRKRKEIPFPPGSPGYELWKAGIKLPRTV